MVIAIKVKAEVRSHGRHVVNQGIQAYGRTDDVAELRSKPVQAACERRVDREPAVQLLDIQAAALGRQTSSWTGTILRVA
jgi:hypothetical protein